MHISGFLDKFFGVYFAEFGCHYLTPWGNIIHDESPSDYLS